MTIVLWSDWMGKKPSIWNRFVSLVASGFLVAISGPIILSASLAHKRVAFSVPSYQGGTTSSARSYLGVLTTPSAHVLQGGMDGFSGPASTPAGPFILRLRRGG
jgi:hypothetical protein